MPENKAQTLTELYGLRAGLSAIAIAADKYKGKDSQTRNKVREQELRVQNAEKDLQKATENLRRLENELANARKELSEQPPQAQRVEGGGVVKIIFSVLLAVAVTAGVLFACIAIIQALFHTEGNIEGTEDVVVGVIISIVVCAIGLALIGLTIWLVVHVSSKVRKERADIKNANRMKRETYEYVQKNAARTVAELPDIIKNSRADIARFPAEIERAKEDHKKAVAEREQILALHIAKGNALYNVVSVRYNYLLAESDWASIDYVIYLLETRRADTIKEALQQLDTERRKNEIVNSIGIAAKYVGETIRRSVQSLQGSMERCFSEMSKMLQTAFERQEMLLKNITKGISTVSVQLVGIQKSVDFGNALLQKANETSGQIAGSVQYMRNLAESADIRRRSGG